MSNIIFASGLTLTCDPAAYPLYVADEQAFYYHFGFDADGDAMIGTQDYAPEAPPHMEWTPTPLV